MCDAIRLVEQQQQQQHAVLLLSFSIYHKRHWSKSLEKVKKEKKGVEIRIYSNAITQCVCLQREYRCLFDSILWNFI